MLIRALFLLWQAVPASTTRLPALSDTATYQTPALQAIVTAAARLNRLVPPGLGGYRARMESEISIGSKHPDRGEVSMSTEQVASELTWNRNGAFEQRVLGYRSQAMAMQFATLGFFRNAWAVPSLYGNRLALLFGRDTASRRSASRGGGMDRSTVYAVHPLAEDRERVYRFRGGDTVEVLRVGGREIPIIRVDVIPRAEIHGSTVVFTGEVDLDATRKHIVRMRGYFARVGGQKRKFDVLAPARLQAIAFVELENGEVNQSYWLPSYQRFEAQATAEIVGDSRAVFRIVSRFRHYEVTPSDSATTGDIPLLADTLQQLEHRLSFAPPDSMNGFADWHAEIGTMSSAVSATDFDDVAPNLWRTTGPPRTSVRPERVDDLVHINRIEGPWTGFGVTHEFRDQVPGLSARLLAGYAWSERTVRGRVIGEYQKARTRWALRAGRSLDITNDFRIAWDSGNATSALLGVDDYDYVDRRSAILSATRLLPDRFGSAVRLDVGIADDKAVAVSMARAPLGRREFRMNRGSSDGRYAHAALTLDWRQDINGELMRTGFGGRIHYERGDGQLHYQRLEARLATRWNHDRLTFAARGDVGEVYGRKIPPQQLFELGSSEALPGYDYKEFAGNRAALVRGLVMYRLNGWSMPIRLTRRFWLPSPSPALSVGVQAGWTDISTSAAQVAVFGLGTTQDPNSLAIRRPISRASDGVRATVEGGVRFFGGAVGLLVARPLDPGGKWRVMLTMGQF